MPRISLECKTSAGFPSPPQLGQSMAPNPTGCSGLAFLYNTTEEQQPGGLSSAVLPCDFSVSLALQPKSVHLV